MKIKIKKKLPFLMFLKQIKGYHEHICSTRSSNLTPYIAVVLMVLICDCAVERAPQPGTTSGKKFNFSVAINHRWAP